MKTFSFLLGVLALGIVTGCGTAPEMDYESVGLVNASGTVTLDGNPLPNAVVKFINPEGQYSVGKTDESGKYTLQFDSEKAGVPPGEKTVHISTAASLGEGMEEEAPPGEASEESETQAEKKTELVPEKYNKNSELKVTVKPDEAQTFDFDLKSK